jgi:hypothetical protein
MPGWTGSLTTPDTHDVAVFSLDRAITNIAPAVLAPVGFLDELSTRRGQTDAYFTTTATASSSASRTSSTRRSGCSRSAT